MRRSLLAASVAALATLACERGVGRSRPEAEPEAPATAEAPPRLFELHGAPGPWSRAGASDAEFARESHACLASSREARHRAPPEASADAAYRAFLDCMQSQSWRRGGRAPPSVTPPAPR